MTAEVGEGVTVGVGEGVTTRVGVRVGTEVGVLVGVAVGTSVGVAGGAVVGVAVGVSWATTVGVAGPGRPVKKMRPPMPKRPRIKSPTKPRAIRVKILSCPKPAKSLTSSFFSKASAGMEPALTFSRRFENSSRRVESGF